MIFYASQRANHKELARHLMNGHDNEHVTVHEVRGFMSEDVAEALDEAHAISLGTRCKKFLFSVSMNPPETAEVSIEAYEATIDDIERKLRLVDQPRIIVFHEKNGRRHCHVVWSRIDGEKMVAINMSHFKLKLMEVSRQLFLQYGWTMPKGLQRGKDSSPFNLTREEHRQAVRLSQDAIALKTMFKQSWERTDSKETFVRLLQDNGFFLAKGDSRGFVAVDIHQKPYSLTRWLDIGTRDLKARLGPPDKLPTIEQARAFISSRMTENLARYLAEAKDHIQKRRSLLKQEIRGMTLHHRADRQALIDLQQKRRDDESRVRRSRFSTGVTALWDLATGEYKRKRDQNEKEIDACLKRDAKELHDLIYSQLKERRELEKTVRFYREEDRQELSRLRQEIARYISTATEPPREKLDKPIPRAGTVSTAAKIAIIESQITVKSHEILKKIAEYRKGMEPQAVNRAAPRQRGKSPPVKAAIPPAQTKPVASKPGALPERGLQAKSPSKDNKIPVSTASNKTVPQAKSPPVKVQTSPPAPSKSVASKLGALLEGIARNQPAARDKKAPVSTALNKTVPQQGKSPPIKIDIPPAQTSKSGALPERGLQDKSPSGANRAPASTAVMPPSVKPAGRPSEKPVIPPARAGSPPAAAPIAPAESRFSVKPGEMEVQNTKGIAPQAGAADRAAPPQGKSPPIQIEIPPAVLPVAAKSGVMPDKTAPDKPPTTDNRAAASTAAAPPSEKTAVPSAETAVEPPPEKSGSPPAKAEPLTVAAQIAVTELQLKILSGDILTLQASLESNLISDEMRARIRFLIEKAAAALQLKALGSETLQRQAEAKSREIAQKQAEFNELVKRYAELQQKQEEERRRIAANREFYGLINNMSYSLNGIPRWQIPVMMPEANRLDERGFVQTVQQRDNTALVSAILNSPSNESLVSRRPPINPPMAVPALRANILQAQELLARAGLRPPSGGGTSRVAPAPIRMTAAPIKVTSKFNAQKR